MSPTQLKAPPTITPETRERFNLTVRLRLMWEEAGCPQDLTNFVNRFDVWEIVSQLGPVDPSEVSPCW